MMAKVGDRVFAVSHSDENVVYLFGYGVYDGDFIPSEDIRFIGFGIDFPNPRITLDDGKVVWGCECWWGALDELRIKGREVVEVDIEAARNEARARHNHDA